MLIDVNEDPYPIDFGGGYTDGWIEKENSNSFEGDLQCLENIKWYLFRTAATFLIEEQCNT